MSVIEEVSCHQGRHEVLEQIQLSEWYGIWTQPWGGVMGYNWRVTSLWNTVKGGSAIMAASSLSLLAKVMVTMNATFTERWVMAQIARGSKGSPVRVDRSRLRSHWGMGLMPGGKFLIKSFIKCTVTECVKMECPLPGKEGANRCKVFSGRRDS